MGIFLLQWMGLQIRNASEGHYLWKTNYKANLTQQQRQYKIASRCRPGTLSLKHIYAFVSIHPSEGWYTQKLLGRTNSTLHSSPPPSLIGHFRPSLPPRVKATHQKKKEVPIVETWTHRAKMPGTYLNDTGVVDYLDAGDSVVPNLRMIYTAVL